ncbi:MAG: sialidase family protein [Solirubrobacteraceae bacterium]
MRRLVRFTGLVAVCVFAVAAPAQGQVGPLTAVSGTSPFAPGCNGAPQSGTEYRNAEVEPHVNVSVADARNVVGAWQQDRYSNGGANGQLAAYSLDGGDTWASPPLSPASNTGQAKFSRCTFGNAANGGDFERATDPWLGSSPNGVLHQVSLVFNDTNVENAILTARSTDGGGNWEDPVTVKFDDNATIFNDKETLTANQYDSRFVYVTWQRLVFPREQASARAAINAPVFRSVAWFARSDDNGRSYDVVKPVFDPGTFNQTIGNQIVVLPNRDLVMVFNWIRNVGNPRNRGFTAAVIRSTDNGDSWSRPIVIDRMLTDGVRDPSDGHAVRTGDLIPQIAVDDRTGKLYVVWQDDRFTGQEQIAMATSTDGGRSWSRARRISNVGGANQAFTPSVTVADDGDVAVTHYDFRNDAGTPGAPLTTDSWILRSTNGGATFSEEMMGAPFDMTTAPDAGGYFVGDYEGLDFGLGGFKPFFARANDGNFANRTDVFATTAP